MHPFRASPRAWSDHVRNQSKTRSPCPGQAQRQRGYRKPEMSSIPSRSALGFVHVQHHSSQAWDNSALTWVSISMGWSWPGPRCKVRAPAVFTLTWQRRGHSKILFLKKAIWRCHKGYSTGGRHRDSSPDSHPFGQGTTTGNVGRACHSHSSSPCCDLCPHLLSLVSFSHDSFWSQISAQERVPGVHPSHTHCPVSLGTTQPCCSQSQAGACTASQLLHQIRTLFWSYI